VTAQKISVQQLLEPLVTILPTAMIHQSLVQGGCYGRVKNSGKGTKAKLNYYKQ